MYPLPETTHPAPRLVTMKAKTVKAKRSRMRRKSQRRHEARQSAPARPVRESTRRRTPSVTTRRSRFRSQVDARWLCETPAPYVMMATPSTPALWRPSSR